MKPRWLLLCVLIIGLVPTGIQAQGDQAEAMTVQPREPVTITWYVGLGSGQRDEQLEVQQRIVAEFNDSQDAIVLEFFCTCVNGATATDVIQTLIASGSQVDIIGPAGFVGADTFKEFRDIEWLDLQPLVESYRYDLSQFPPNMVETYRRPVRDIEWLDLQPLVESHGYDLSQFPPNMVETYRTPDGGLSALPFAVFPGVLYYNVDLFDAAGLHYPPTVPGEPYIMPDGSSVPWDYDTVASIGALLTLDGTGHNATHPDFDPANIVQFGFTHHWDNLRSNFHTFGDAPLLTEDGQVIIWDNWRAQAHWYWDGLWKYRFIPSDAQVLSEGINSNPFASGRVAMARSMAWYTCCLEELDAHWDIALQPAYQGTIYAPADFDSFYIHKATEHPDEAFIVLEYLLGAGAFDLLETYQVFPARLDLQDATIARYQERYPAVQNWVVLTISGQFTPAIHQESRTPNHNDIQGRFGDFLALLRGENGANIDLDAELDKLQSDLQTIVDAGIPR